MDGFADSHGVPSDEAGGKAEMVEVRVALRSAIPVLAAVPSLRMLAADHHKPG
jgi:hypothetical protein